MNRIKKMRRFALLALVVAGSLTLAACNGNSKTPYGDLSSDVNYLTYSGYTVNEKELYDQFRVQGSSILSQLMEESVFSDYVAQAESLLASGSDEEVMQYFYDLVNDAIFSETDEETLQDTYIVDGAPNDKYVRLVEQFVDSIYLLDNTTDLDALKASILGLTTPFTGYETIAKLVDTYKLSVGERIYASEILAEEVVDEDSDNYIEDSDLVTYYQNNVEGQYDVNALVIRFINLNEANAALYQVGLKSDSKGLWYQIPDIRISDTNADGYVDLTLPKYAHVVTILDDLGLLGKMGTNYADRSKISTSDFEDYYKAYTIVTDRDLYPDTALTNEEVKAKFVEIYNLLNPSAQVEIDAVTGDIVGKDGADFSTTYTYDDLTDINTSLRSHIYTTLTAETQIEDASTEKAYSSRVQTFGDFRYLVYKLDDDSASEDGILIEDPDDEDSYIFDDTAAADAAKEDARANIIENKLTSSYISSAASDYFAEAEINIYDRILRILFSQSYDYSGSEKNKTGNVVADVNGTEITVQEFYDEVEKSYGINLSLDIVLNKYLTNSDEYTVSDDDMADYESQFEDIITAFGSDSYSSYPASMGREAFLLVAFGATNNEEAINQLYVYPDLRSQYLEDYEAQYSNDNSTIYEKFAELAALQYDNEKSISVSHLLIYFDNNADGTPDDPAEYLDSLSEAGRQEVIDGLLNLMNGYNDGTTVYQGVYDRLGEYTDMSSALSDIADEFNSSGRIERGSFYETDPVTGDVISYKDLQPELYWAQFRQLGFYMTYETISTEITNTSNLMTNSSTLDTVFYDRAINIYNTLSTIPDDDSKFPYLDFYDQYVNTGTAVTEEDLTAVESSFGWHFIMAESVGEHSSAIYSALDDTDNEYINTDLNLDVYNLDSETLTASQIEYYLTLDATDEGAPLPDEVDAAITAYLTPVITKYTGTYMQRELIFKLASTTDFANSEDSGRFDIIREINRRQFNSYLLSEDGGVYDSNYAALYASWFDILES